MNAQTANANTFSGKSRDISSVIRVWTFWHVFGHRRGTTGELCNMTISYKKLHGTSAIIWFDAFTIFVSFAGFIISLWFTLTLSFYIKFKPMLFAKGCRYIRLLFQHWTKLNLSCFSRKKFDYLNVRICCKFLSLQFFPQSRWKKFSAY